MENNYWSKLLSMVIISLSEDGQSEAAYVAKHGEFELRYVRHDNWDGGIDYCEAVFHLKYRDYLSVESHLKEISEQIASTLDRFHKDEREIITDVLIEPLIEHIIDWKAVLPESKESTIRLIEEERNQLLANAVGQASYKEEGAEETYQNRHRRILEIAQKAGFDYPIVYNSLSEWWVFIKEVGGYADRRAYVSETFAAIVKTLAESENSLQGSTIDFSRITQRTQTISFAINDAETLMRGGRVSSAVDRIHTAFHGYLRQLLDTHQLTYDEGETLSQLYSKLHTFYGSSIQPPDVADLVRTALRSASGVVSSINDIRNRHTIAHPNADLIQAREAMLIIGLVKTVVDYLEDIEQSIKSKSKCVSP